MSVAREERKNRGEVRKADTQVVTLRVPKEFHEAMRTFAFATDTTINDVAIRAIHSFLSGEGREEQVDAFLDRARGQWRVALDKLAET